MYHKFFSHTMIIVFAAAAAAVSDAALAQNQTTSDGTLPANATASNMTLDSIKEQYLSAWNQTEFNAAFSTFVELFSAAGYGVYEEHENVFRPGEKIVLYVEPVGFDHEQVLDDQGNTLYLMNMSADYTIASANGTELQTIEGIPVGSIISHRPNTELFLELTLTQESPLPVGDYLITYAVTDEVSGESFQLEKEITIAETTASSSLA
jgi:hypothetical protein